MHFPNFLVVVFQFQLAYWVWSDADQFQRKPWGMLLTKPLHYKWQCRDGVCLGPNYSESNYQSHQIYHYKSPVKYLVLEDIKVGTYQQEVCMALTHQLFLHFLTCNVFTFQSYVFNVSLTYNVLIKSNPELEFQTYKKNPQTFSCYMVGIFWIKSCLFQHFFTYFVIN